MSFCVEFLELALINNEDKKHAHLGMGKHCANDALRLA